MCLLSNDRWLVESSYASPASDHYDEERRRNGGHWFKTSTHFITRSSKKPVKIEDMFIDIGASSKEEAQEFGVKPGDSIVPYFEFTQLKNEKMLLAKAWDNRIGCAIAIE